MTVENKSFYFQFLLFFILPLLGGILSILFQNGLFVLIIAPAGFLGMGIFHFCFSGKVFWRGWHSKPVCIVLGILWILFAIFAFLYLLYLTKTGEFFPIRFK